MLSLTYKPFMLSVFMLNVVMLSVFMLSVFMLSVFILNVVMLSVVAPYHLTTANYNPISLQTSCESG
jgi:hypothetical protein